MKKITILIIATVLLIVGCSKKQSKRAGIDALLKSTVIDLNKIKVEPKVIEADEKILDSYNGNYQKLSTDIDSLLKKYPNSYIFKGFKLQLLSSKGEAEMLQFVKKEYYKDTLNVLNKYFYGLMTDVKTGENLFISMIENHPENYLGYFGYAQKQMMKKPLDLEKAGKLTYLAVLKNPKKDETLNLLGIIYSRLNQPEAKAVIDGKRLIIDPSNISAFREIFYFYKEANQLSKASDLIDVFVKNNPDKLPNTDIAYYYMSLKNYDKAYEYIKKARNAKEPELYSNYMEAKIYAEQGKASKAMIALSKFYKTANERDKKMIIDPAFSEILFKDKRYIMMLKEVEDGAPTVGDKMSKITGKLLDGTEVDMSKYEGKVLLLDFWASWCSPCKGEIPHVIAVYDKLNSKGFEVLGVSLDRKKEDITEYMKTVDMKWKHIFPGQKLAESFKISGIPATFLIDKKGIIRYKNIRGKEILMQKVEKLLKEK